MNCQAILDSSIFYITYSVIQMFFWMHNIIKAFRLGNPKNYSFICITAFIGLTDKTFNPILTGWDT